MQQKLLFSPKKTTAPAPIGLAFLPNIAVKYSPHHQEVKLSLVRNKPLDCTGTIVGESGHAANYLREIWEDLELHESTYVLALSQANEIMCWMKIAVGSLSSVIMCPRKIQQFVILSNAAAFIVAHNHPSGKLKPSEADVKITKQLRDGGKLMNTDLLDHLILTPTSYYSFADEGLM